MVTSAEIHLQFVCMRPLHHRHRTSPLSLCEHKGCAAYCPAGDIGGHDWLPVSTDLAGLAGLGYVPSLSDPEREIFQEGRDPECRPIAVCDEADRVLA